MIGSEKSEKDRQNDEQEIADLLTHRSEKGIERLDRQYRKLCMHVARNVLGNEQDAEECVNDAYMKVWNSIPPNRPSSLLAYTLTIVRNLSLNKLLYEKAEKRAQNDLCVSLSELEECLTDVSENDLDLKDLMDRFLRSLSKKDAVLFVRRYWYMDSVEMLSKLSGYSENNVYQRLFVMRGKLRSLLIQEGYSYENKKDKKTNRQY